MSNARAKLLQPVTLGIGQSLFVFAVDPGGVTGAAAWIGNWQGSLASTFRAHDTVECEQFSGEPEQQGIELAEWYRDVAQVARKDWGIKPRGCHLVFETFALRQRSVDLSPVEVTVAMRTVLAVRRWDALGITSYQQPSEAKGFATPARLKHFGLYGAARGKPHARDATRHLALKVSKLAG